MKWTKEEEQYLINNQHLSYKEISSVLHLSISPSSLTSKKRRLGLINNNHLTKLETILSDEQINIFNGCLLGDAYLGKSTGCNSGNYCFRLKSITEEFITTVKDVLPFKWCKDYVRPAKKALIKGKLCNCNTSFECISRTDKTITRLANQWYPEGKKIIPKDLVLSPSVVKYWFYGDGCTSWTKNRFTAVQLTLCTDSFTYEECLFLQNLFRDIDIEVRIFNLRTNQYRLSIQNVKNINNFFDYIGECNIKSFQYKWKRPMFAENVNGQKKIVVNGIEYSSYKIAVKTFGVSCINTVKSRIRRGIYNG
jgi:hypothetical protein